MNETKVPPLTNSRPDGRMLGARPSPPLSLAGQGDLLALDPDEEVEGLLTGGCSRRRAHGRGDRDRARTRVSEGQRRSAAAARSRASSALPVLASDPPTRETFPMRNAVMSGYAAATVVVEGRGKCGRSCGHTRSFSVTGTPRQRSVNDYADPYANHLRPVPQRGPGICPSCRQLEACW